MISPGMRKAEGKINRIAILNPLNDYGIVGYTHEFAEGLAANGYEVSVYSDINATLQDLPARRNYELLPVLGKALLKQAALPRLTSSARDAPERTIDALNFAQSFAGGDFSLQSATPVAGRVPDLRVQANTRQFGMRRRFTTPARTLNRNMRDWIRIRYLSSELAYHLRRKDYDLIWTQWYSPDVFDSKFWRACKRFDTPVLHTVHNVLPHEPKPRDWEAFNRVYGHSRLLVVHSRHAEGELREIFPRHASKAIVMPHGTYSSLHKRSPECRERVRHSLGIEPDSPVLLFCGAVRPYKNIEAVIEALARPEFSAVTLLIAGKESGYPESDVGDPLRRTKALLAKHKVACRVKMIPRMLEAGEMSELFEASDILLLPYLKGYGSGLLLLGLTFGKHVLATDTGGASEYFEKYENHTSLAGATSEDVAVGLAKALAKVRRSSGPAEPPSALSWPSVTAQAMKNIAARLGHTS